MEVIFKMRIFRIHKPITVWPTIIQFDSKCKDVIMSKGYLQVPGIKMFE